MFMFVVVSAVSVILTALEAVYRQDWSYWATVAVAAPCIIMAQHGLYYLFHHSSSVVAASVTLGIMTAAMRTGMSIFILEENLDPVMIGISMALMVLAGYVLKHA